MTRLLRVLCVAFLMFAVPVAMAEEGDKGKEEKKEEKKESKRNKIDARANELLDEVLAFGPAKALYDKAVGWAVFDNTKAALGVSGGGGSGLAVDKETGERTYMKMGTVGVGLGIGVKTYQVIMFFEKEPVFRNFIEKGWQADAEASATAGTEGATAKSTFHNGMALFVKTKKGLMANADVAGTKYWKSDLNE